MELKREYARGNLAGSGVITLFDGHRELAFDLVTISAAGMLVETTETLEPGDAVKVKVTVTGVRFEKTIGLEGVVLSRTLAGCCYQHAIKIKKLDPKHRIEIDAMVAMFNTWNEHVSEGLAYDEDEDSDLAENWPAHASNPDDKPNRE